MVKIITIFPDLNKNIFEIILELFEKMAKLPFVKDRKYM